ncbi:hypothetical protein QYE76_012491 [Lolium multiflorum]|uniref:Transposon protein, putative, CACTA, En/Spm sub-class n=1 Tax=Lolium multiflorum TaxID=4521 RepID=A0AAD8X6Q7_LOLMU|nr:hypothetical protein QYE76_012491 [Lolium multiflorum]
MKEDEEGDDIDDSYLDHFDDTFMEDAEGGKGEGRGEGEGHQEEARDEPANDLGRTIADARSRCETEKERENLDRMLEDHKKSLYPGCDNGLKKLGCTLDLLRWKAQEGVADSGFENLLKMLKNMFPKNNELPSSTYEAKKVVCPLGLEVLKIHACINDCILYRGEYENLNECPVCTALRYKIRGDDPGDDVEGEKPRKKVPAKVMCSPLIRLLLGAARCYQRVVALDPDNAEAGEALCNLLDVEGKESLELAVCKPARRLLASRRAHFGPSGDSATYRSVTSAAVAFIHYYWLKRSWKQLTLIVMMD